VNELKKNNRKVMRSASETRCNRPEYTPGRFIPGVKAA